ncbi:hypothetical protein CJF16_19815 [Clostridium botulinum]|uniref:Uncharacterized protein n=2 Tax=Clostridium botulinum TaxID=1491 RepID=C1FTK4_CLOBJ|nr:hypothetical protein [Clostridium botulinum]ACO85122.1 hypothetical protein CLM_2956 [Clostridium botulinum A2 str. Kyoto]AUN04040.1 hypothetical protein RSJ19_14475 [Clostridium botulinum]MBN3396043.1 hypothetical protein [Clostridium botulinum]MBN3426647.1 hypothetical protein [Clostridium botulinum]MBN3436875.1 hypothetical protein [Clostridium botulinum]
MSSSGREIMEALKPFAELGMLGIIPNDDLEEEKYCKVKYNQPGTMGEIFTDKELSNLPQSKLMREAIENGYKTNQQIIDYCNHKKEIIKSKAIEIGKPQISDTIGIFSCKDANEECSWDIVCEIVTPRGEFLYKREHTW